MRRLFTTLILGTVTLMTSCQDKHNISVTGQIKDELTGDPIPNTDVVVLCWYSQGLDDASFKKETLTTDNSGNFTTKFDKGHEVNVAAQSNGFLPSRVYTKLESSEINLSLRLKKMRKNETLISRLTTELDLVSVTEKTPFLKLRTQNNKTVTYGFDFGTLTTNTDTSVCDFWFKVERKPTTLVAHDKAGIIPILKNEVRSSLLYEMEQAPSTGYQNSYTLRGQEEGFFIRCRDGKTFAKIILTKGTVDISGPINGSAFKDQGKYFSYLYQPNGTTDVAFSTKQIDLERFLVDDRFR